ncbi:1,2-phenylacetyl-CoA epoxidase, subunit C [mine drainage metagenome]|uniref:1,2-phenylacetyl-CoA epoxidase, subunit C n=1 Tax=mine drainage metagenome TaxID=410659 RepID=A0A1J5PPK7_9ZZZZ
MQDSITVGTEPTVRYLLRLGDTCLIHAQRLGEWCGHAPIIEEDIALTNIALDLIGQARGILTRAGQLDSRQFDEDQLAFLRDERDYLNPTLVELPRGDFAVTTVRNLMVAALLEPLWDRLRSSADAEVAAVAGKAVKEARYHHVHAADWLVRLGDGTAESRRRIEAALDRLWPYSRELFQSDAIDDAASASGLGPRWAELREPWLAAVRDALDAAGLEMPAETTFLSAGRMGIHSEHMGHMLAEMQHLQRSYPGGVW